MNVLAADIGGTKTLLELSDEHGRCLASERVVSGEYASFDDLLEDFLGRYRAPGQISACFAIAGPVHHDGRRAEVTNLPWHLDAAAIARRHKLARVRLINDFSAVAYGIEVLADEDLVPLQSGEAARHAPRLVVGAGTGFGVGQLFWCDGAYRPMASEGGHIDFAPVDERQDALLDYLRRRWEHVSVERLLSGRGLVNLYDYLREVEGLAVSVDLEREFEKGDPAAILSRHAQLGDEPVATEVFELFRAIYGAVTGNLALVTMALGGVYVAGGIVAKNVDLFKDDRIMIDAFLDKGRMRALLERMPVSIVTNESCGLMGAARAATLDMRAT